MRGWEHLTAGDAAKLGKQARKAMHDPLCSLGQHAGDQTMPCDCHVSRIPKPSKYRNVKVVVDGLHFDSKREANYWLLLKARQKMGEITSLERQVVFDLCAPIRTGIAGPLAVVVAQYLADFSYYTIEGRRHVVDAKGTRTQMYALKKKWLELQDGIVIEEV